MCWSLLAEMRYLRISSFDDLARHAVKLALDVGDSVLDTPVEIHWVHSRSDALASFGEDRARSTVEVVVPSPAISLVLLAT